MIIEILLAAVFVFMFGLAPCMLSSQISQELEDSEHERKRTA
jgi:hypothetical protein